MRFNFKKTLKSIFSATLIGALFLLGFPSVDFFSYLENKIIKKNDFDNPISKAQAATFQMQTGYYVGDGGSQAITGIGFTPELIVLKSNTTAIATIFKTNLMANNSISYMGTATADSTAGFLELDSDGFTVSSTANTVATRYTWIAFAGSDCSSSGTMCIGSYTGDGGATQAITSVGFQPNLVWTKRTTNERSATWKSSSMATNYGQYFSATLEDTTGALFTTLDATGFTVGLSNNTSTGVYHYVAFKEVSGYMDVGSYTGNVTDGQDITGVGFVPDWMFAKNTASTTSAVHNSTESYGDSTSYFTATANLVNSIQLLQSDGFELGSHDTANGSGHTIHYAAFKGAAAHSSSGTFQMASGSYTGDGTYKTINGLDFEPDLVIIKGETTQFSVFRTSLMGGDLSAYLGNPATNIANAITSLNSDGFNVGTSATVNTSGTVYHWQAFGGAWSPETNSGASDFFVGAYYGNGINDRDITRLPFQPDFVVTKRTGASDAAFRTSAHTGDIASFFAATADTADTIQTFNSDGFEIGTHASVNTAATLYYYFGFKEGSDFDVGTYTGNSTDDRDITAPGFDPNLVWIKRSTAVAGVSHPTTLAGDLTQYFITTAQAAGRIKSFVTNGFRLGTQTEVNASGGTYYFVAWDNNSSQGSPSAATYKVQTGYYIGNGGELSISGLGFKPELVILKSDSNTIGTIFKTNNMPAEGTGYLGQALADVATGMITLDADGFTTTGSGNSVLVRYTWVAFAGSDCSASGKFCIGAYTGDGGATKAITTVGFQPDLVIVKRTSNERAGTWRSSSMATNYGQYLNNLQEDTTGTLFTTLDATGFTVGLSNNTSTGVYYYLAFKETAGSIDVGSYTGDSADNRSITGVGFSPEFVFLKNAAVTGSAMHLVPESYGDSGKYFTNTANLVNTIQALEADGFQVGSDVLVNFSGNTIYYAAFNGTESNSTGSGNFVMDKGSYTGNGVFRKISGLAFEPDLVIIKGETTQAGVFRTSSMWGDSSAYLDAGTANLTNAITALNSDGFNVGSGANVNTSGTIYHWQAFGGAWQPETDTGATDFFIGAYYGNAQNDRDITRLPFQPDLVTIKRNGATGGIFRTSAHASDVTSFFAATADGANYIQAFNSDGFELGDGGNAVNLSANQYWYFGFNEGTKFDVGTYTGDAADDRDITAPNFDPDLLWIKRSTAVAGVTRPSTLAGDLTQYFITTAQAAGRIKAFITGGFRLGTQTEVNASGGTYYFSAWSETGVVSPTFEQAAYRFFENDNSTDVGAALAAQDTAADLGNTGDAFRLRALLAVGASNLSISGQDFKLQYVDKGAGTCAAPSGGTPATYTDVTGATLIAYEDNATPADADTLTANANDPTDGGNTIVNQSYQELNNFTNDEAAINNGQDGKWDFALVDNGADADTTFCFKIVTSAGDDLDTYTVYPEITTAPTSQTLTFSISDSSVGFGNLSASSARYATGDTTGSGSDSADAHTISVATNASGGYILSINGNTLTCASCGGSTIDAIGSTAVASSAGSEQFGLRLAVNSGNGASTAPYASANWAFDTASLPDQVASGDGSGTTTQYGVRYIANISSVADAGDYSAILTYTATATY